MATIQPSPDSDPRTNDCSDPTTPGTVKLVAVTLVAGCMGAAYQIAPQAIETAAKIVADPSSHLLQFAGAGVVAFFVLHSQSNSEDTPTDSLD